MHLRPSSTGFTQRLGCILSERRRGPAALFALLSDAGTRNCRFMLDRFAQTVTTSVDGQTFDGVLVRPLAGLSSGWARSAVSRKLWCAFSAVAATLAGRLAGSSVVASAVANIVSMALGLSFALKGGICLAMRATRVVSAHRQCSTLGGQRFRGRASSLRGVSRAAKIRGRAARRDAYKTGRERCGLELHRSRAREAGSAVRRRRGGP